MTGCVVGIDLGGTAIKAAVADVNGNVLAQGSIDTQSHDGPSRVLQRIADHVIQLRRRCSDGGVNITSVGMGVPGLVDVQSGVSKFLPNFPTQWRDIPITAQLSDSLGCPVNILNDVRTATLGELRFGRGRGRRNLSMAFFSLGTGVGGGVVIDGRLRLGPLGAAGELGHQTMQPNGRRCGCGNHGCLETIASGPAIAAEGVRLMRMGLAPRLYELVDGDSGLVTTQQMSIAANDDPLIRQAIEQAANYIGIAASNVVTILHPEMIVLGGGVAQIGALLVDTVRKVITERVGMFPTDGVTVLASELGDQAGVLGAIALADTTLTDTTLAESTLGAIALGRDPLGPTNT
ncbi:ROK family protein [Stieleria tagensis]|uniref:ROK family protein n=1 Tax=Stieleria tagensis TaxID=2956795 RepID=UPI00209B1A4A|nr:ROK family protein [Stieleria tagensis]